MIVNVIRSPTQHHELATYSAIKDGRYYRCAGSPPHVADRMAAASLSPISGRWVDSAFSLSSEQRKANEGYTLDGVSIASLITCAGQI